jgi:hypothetical protein
MTRFGQAAVLAAAQLGQAAVLAATLGACSTYSDKVVENAVPKDFKPEILDQLRGSLTDPTGIRDAYISEPALKTSGGTTRYVACVRYNAKNDDGAYAGSKDVAAFYYDGQLTQIVTAPELCGNAAYRPFPELTKLCRTIDCKA